MTQTFTLDDLLRVARREKNTKRPYLYVNPLQGKHIPVSPSRALSVFTTLGAKAELRYAGERLLIIGFAETATAIGLTIGLHAKNAAFCMTTTREAVPESGYLFFTESHSHATEQRLALRGFADCLPGVDRIVFAEDEVTTGNTIEKLIRAIQNAFPDYRGGFGILSILNSMSPDRLQELEQKGIFCDWLCRIPFQYRIDEISRYTYEPLETKIPIEGPGLPEQVIGGGWNPRVATASGAARERCAAFVSQALSSFRLAPEDRKVLILGTEECMAPGLFLGQALEKEHPELTVRFHAATRSPIDVSLDPEYPLHSRFPLDSLYEQGRHTFLYNLAAYDRIILVTDAPTVSPGGSASIQNALERCGNHENMTLLVWREDSHA